MLAERIGHLPVGDWLGRQGRRILREQGGQRRSPNFDGFVEQLDVCPNPKPPGCVRELDDEALRIGR
jgi:hypothetical protein